jgi:hypothetical protein
MGAGIYVEGSPVIRRCEFTGNQAGSGGGVRVLGPGAALIVDCVIHENTAVGLGGGIASEDSAQTLIRRCRIWGNAAGDGGGICLSFTGGRIEDCEIRDNTAAFGGGLDLLSSDGATVSRVEIFSNEADFVGGGVYAITSRATLEDCTIRGNTTAGDGGAAWLLESDLAFERCAFRENSAEGTAGGLYVRQSFAQLRNGELEGNGLAVFVEGIPNLPVDARFNWWGDASGPYHPLLNPGGRGDEVGDHVDFTPWNGASGAPEPDGTAGLRLRAPGLFRSSLPVTLTLPVRTRVGLALFDAQGRCLARLLEGEAGPGAVALRWDGREAGGAPARTGVCFLRLSVDGAVQTRRVVRVR